MTTNNYSDLHLHTNESLVGNEVFSWDGIIPALKTLLSNNIKYFAFTDHDSFNYKYFLQAKEIIKKNNLNLVNIPGFEASVLNANGDKSHLIFYFENDLCEKDYIIISQLIKQNINRNGVTINKFIDLFNKNNINFIISAHIGKVNSIKVSDIEKIKSNLVYIEGNKENANMKKALSLYPNLTMVDFSDTHVWQKYKGCNEQLNMEYFFSKLGGKHG